MLLPDVNVLIYAHRQDAADHARYREWLEIVSNDDAAFGLAPHYGGTWWLTECRRAPSDDRVGRPRRKHSVFDAPRPQRLTVARMWDGSSNVGTRYAASTRV
jgi:predicted nucleic acid-binding protein